MIRRRGAGAAVGLGVALALAACDDGVGLDPDPFLNCPVLVYEIGATVNGTLTPSDCPLLYHGLADGRVVDFWGFTLGASRTVTIEMASVHMDSYLILWDRQSGRILAEDDDSGNGLTARITLPLSPGRYVIGATSFWPEEAGSYTLSSR
jgi:hypothetical protein